MSNFNNKTFKIIKILSNVILLLLPIAFILGNAALNVCLTLFIFFFILSLIKENDLQIFKNIFFNILAVFWLYLLINSVFINYNENSIIKTIGYIRFFLLPFALLYFFTKQLIFKSIFFYFYSLVFFVVSIDIIYQFLYGTNSLGFIPKMCVTVSKNYYNEFPQKFDIVNFFDHPYLNGQVLVNCERFSGFFNEELVAGTYLLIFGLPILTFLMNFRKQIKFSKFIFFLLLFFMILASLLSGDRTPILIISITACIFLIFLKVQFKKKIYLFSVIIFIFSIIISITPHLKHRFISWPTQTLFNENESSALSKKKNNPLFKVFLFETQWGLHYLTAYDLAKQNIFFGNGVKSFRLNCKKYEINYLKSKYLNPEEYKDYKEGPNSGCSTHPHNIYMELLSETGILGLLIFITFIFVFIFKTYKKNKNQNNIIFIFMLASILSQLFPFKPTGSFFSTFNAYLIWINIGLYFYWSEIKYIKHENV